MVTFSCFFALFNSLFTFLTFVQSCVSLKEVLTRKKILLFSPIIGGTKLKFMHLFVRTSPINRFCFDFQFYLLFNLKVGSSKLSLPVQTPTFENLGLKFSKIQSFWK